MMDYDWDKYSMEEYSPHLVFLPDKFLTKCIKKRRKACKGKMYFLDVGGRKGRHRNKYAAGYEYHILDIDRKCKKHGAIYGDICGCPQIASGSYDVVFSHNVFEHLREPWRAAEECVRLTKKGGLLIHSAPFSWRYHPVPVDCYRYTHDGLEYLFRRTGLIKTVFAGYDDISNRRGDSRGGKLPGKLDVPPIDHMGGWRENWRAVFVGVRL